jgi:hypothetical protein
VAEVGCLLLARIDGKSPVEYITDEPTRDLVRDLGAQLVTEGGDSVPGALATAAGAIPDTVTAP